MGCQLNYICDCEISDFICHALHLLRFSAILRSCSTQNQTKCCVLFLLPPDEFNILTSKRIRICTFYIVNTVIGKEKTIIGEKTVHVLSIFRKMIVHKIFFTLGIVRTIL